MIWLAYFLILAVVCGAAIYASRRNTSIVTETRYDPPEKIERNDFPALNAETLVVVFTSRVCNSCENIVTKAKVLQSDQVDVAEIEYEDSRGKELHAKYQIEAVPTLVICNENGVVEKAYVGSVTATDLWAAVARTRGAEIQSCSDHDD